VLFNVTLDFYVAQTGILPIWAAKIISTDFLMPTGLKRLAVPFNLHIYINKVKNVVGIRFFSNKPRKRVSLQINKHENNAVLFEKI